MSSKFFISAIFFFQFISLWCYRTGGEQGHYPRDLTGFIPTATISRTTSLYATDINMSLTVYQRPINDALKQTLRVINGSTNVDSTNRCIAYGVSFFFWGQYPIINSQATGNGGCDAILGRACSRSIHNLLRQSFGDINSNACGVSTGNILTKSPTGCPSPTVGQSGLLEITFLNKGSFMYDGSSAANSSTWGYDKTAPSINGDYDDVMKEFVFTYFVGRPYSSGIIDSAIACFSIYNTTVGGNTRAELSGTATQLVVSGKLLIFLSLLHFFSRFIVSLP